MIKKERCKKGLQGRATNGWVPDLEATIREKDDLENRDTKRSVRRYILPA